MSTKAELDLQWKVRFYLGNGKSDEFIINELCKLGFERATIKKYIKEFSK